MDPAAARMRRQGPIVISSTSANPGGPLSTTPTSTASSSSPSNVITFNSISSMETCGMTELKWSYSGSDTLLSIYVAKSDNSSSQLLGVTDPQYGYWWWQAVNVTAGQYRFLGDMATGNATSQVFTVTQGTNTSCLSTSSTSSTPHSSAPPTGSASSTNSITPTAVSEAASSNKHTGAIAGGVIGGLAALTAVLAVLWVCLRRRPRVRFAGPGVGRWGSLTSNISTKQGGVGGGGLASSHYRGHSDSATGGILGSVSQQSVKPSAVSTPAVSADDVTVPPNIAFGVPAGAGALAAAADMGRRSSIDKHSPPRAGSMVGFDGIDDPLPRYNKHRGSAYSFSPASPTESGDLSHASSLSRQGSAARRGSGAQLETQAQRLRSSMDSFAHPRFERRTSLPPYAPALPPAFHPANPTSPTSPVSPASLLPISGMSKGAGHPHRSSASRRTQRKPVPAYDASEFPAADNRSTTGTVNTAATGSSNAEHGLSHKASFGSGPVHYLIPDMPPPPPRD